MQVSRFCAAHAARQRSDCKPLAGSNALAIKDIDSNDKVNGSMKYVWLGVVYLVPFFGVLVYHLAGPSAISRSMKLAAIVGGLFSYIAILVAGAVISGLV